MDGIDQNPDWSAIKGPLKKRFRRITDKKAPAENIKPQETPTKLPLSQGMMRQEFNNRMDPFC